MKTALSAAYRRVTSLRNTLYDKGIWRTTSTSLPTICIGNITVGGSGKTPIVQKTVQMLSAQNRHPVILMRGYGGSIRGPIQVSQFHDASEVGDEAKLHAAASEVPVVIARDRVSGAQFIESEQIGDIIILDDGLQHRRLARDLNVITIDVASEGVASDVILDRVLPLGLLREARQEGLRRGQIFVLNSRGPRVTKCQLDALRAILPAHVPTIEAWMTVERVVRGERELQPPQKIVAVSGIARPFGFYALLEEMGFEIIAKHAFEDHASFDLDVVTKLRRTYPESAFVCTSKDLARMADDEASRWWVPEVQVEFSEPEVFRKSIFSVISS